LLILATDLAGVSGADLPIEVAAIDSFAAVTDAPERRLQLVGKTSVSLVDILMAREQLCESLDASKDISLYLVDRTESWM
jgi:hypothetical protein